MTSHVLVVLAFFAVIALLSLVVALAAALVTREDGKPWSAAIRLAGTAVPATVVAVTAVAAFVFSVLG
ncbi:hypothetical protein [Nocardiopsis oceani]